MQGLPWIFHVKIACLATTNAHIEDFYCGVCQPNDQNTRVKQNQDPYEEYTKEDKSYNCNKCGHSFPSKFNVKQHIVRKHINNKLEADNESNSTFHDNSIDIGEHVKRRDKTIEDILKNLGLEHLNHIFERENIDYFFFVMLISPAFSMFFLVMEKVISAKT